MKRYDIFEEAANLFSVWMITETAWTRIKEFKTKKAAEAWVKKHS